MTARRRQRGTRRRPAWLVVLALAGTAALMFPANPAVALPQDDRAGGRLLLMLDASGSMNEQDPSGLTKIAAAKRALTHLVDALPDESMVGLRVYGATQPGGKPTPAACADTQLVHQIDTLDRTGLKQAIARFQAKGETPIATSIRAGLKDLGTTGKRSIVLVSDGQESCVSDPCPSIRALIAAGVDLQVNTVGFGVDAKARRQLQCIADAGRGTYYDATDAAGLAASLGKVTARALRSFTVSGKPVIGTTDPVQAPAIGPGLWGDKLSDDTAPVYYRVSHTPGTTLHVAVTMRPAPAGTTADVDRIRQRLLLPDGDTVCAESTSYRFDVFSFASVVSDSIVLDGTKLPRSGAAPDTCRAATDLLLEVRRQVEDATMPPTPTELQVIEEPAVSSTTRLPDAVQVDTTEPPIVVPTAPVRSVTGGGTFEDAATVTSGTWSDTTLVGEELFYRVRLDFGQRLGASVQAPAAGSGFTALGDFTMRIDGFTTDRTRLERLVGQAILAYDGDTKSRSVGMRVPEVRYLNRLNPGGGIATNVSRSSLAGWYYISVRTGSQSDAAKTSHQVIPIRLSVQVTGSPTGRPAYTAVGTPATASATPTTPVAATSPGTAAPSSAPARDSSSFPIGWLAAAVLLVGAAGAGFVRWRRTTS